MKKPKQVKSLGTLDNILEDEQEHDFAIILNGGLYSRKGIRFGEGHYYVYNYIDDTKQRLSAKQIMDESWTNIGLSMKLGGFYQLP